MDKTWKVISFDSFDAEDKLVKSFKHKISAHLYMWWRWRNAEWPKNVKVIKGDK